jgi:hypothetical protein
VEKPRPWWKSSRRKLRCGFVSSPIAGRSVTARSSLWDSVCGGEVTMLRLRPGQRRVLVERFPELANFAMGSLLFGQLLSDRPFSAGLAVSGVAVWVGLFGVTLFLVEQEDP